jgi:hypothetical protein
MADVHLLMTRLLAAIKDALPERTVIDGWLGEDLPHQVVAVGFDSSGGGSPVISVELLEASGGFGYAHFVSVGCTAASWDGDMDTAGKRGQVSADLLTIRERMDLECKATERLGGLVIAAEVTPAEQWYVFIDDRGPCVQCDFTIRAEMHT